MADPDVIEVQFDLTRDQKSLKPRYIQGQEIPDWENGPDMANYIRMMRQRGYQNITKSHDEVYIFRRVQP